MANQLQQLQHGNKEDLANLNDYLSNVQTPPLFVHHLPMDEFYRKCDVFDKMLDIYVKNNFKYQV